MLGLSSQHNLPIRPTERHKGTTNQQNRGKLKSRTRTMSGFDGDASASAIIDEYENQFSKIDSQLDSLRRSLHDDDFGDSLNDDNEPETEHSDCFEGDSDILQRLYHLQQKDDDDQNVVSSGSDIEDGQVDAEEEEFYSDPTPTLPLVPSSPTANTTTSPSTAVSPKKVSDVSEEKESAFQTVEDKQRQPHPSLSPLVSPNLGESTEEEMLAVEEQQQQRQQQQQPSLSPVEPFKPEKMTEEEMLEEQQQGKQRQQQQPSLSPVVPPNPEEMTEEEMLALVMKQSLEEYKKMAQINNSISVSPQPRQGQGIRETADIVTPAETISPPVVTPAGVSTAPLASSTRSLTPNNSNHGGGDFRTPNSSPSIPARNMHLLDSDREFSQRNLQLIESTTVEIESPHKTRKTYRPSSSSSNRRSRSGRRTNSPSVSPPPPLSSSAGSNQQSLSPVRRRAANNNATATRRARSIEDDRNGTLAATISTNISGSPSHAAAAVPGVHHVSASDQAEENAATMACRRRMLMDRARQHLSLKEITEIDQALREAEEAEYNAAIHPSVSAAASPAAPAPAPPPTVPFFGVAPPPPRSVRRNRSGEYDPTVRAGRGRGMGTSSRSFSGLFPNESTTTQDPSRGVARGLSLETTIVPPPPSSSSSGDRAYREIASPSATAMMLDNSILGSNVAASATATAASVQDGAISAEEAASIEAALREADALEAAKRDAAAKAEMESMLLAHQMQMEAERASRDEVAAKSDMDSMMLAQQMQIEAFIQAGLQQQNPNRQQPQGNVRSMRHAQLDYESGRASHSIRSVGSGSGRNHVGAMHASHPPQLHPLEVESTLRGRPTGNGYTESNNSRRPLPPTEQHLIDDNRMVDTGFRMNAQSSSSSLPPGRTAAAVASQLPLRGSNATVRANDEIRPKHDLQLPDQANAHILGLDVDDYGVRAEAGEKALDLFKQNLKKPPTNKTDATLGTGPAGSNIDSTRGKAMDPHVRLQISRAISSGLIHRCNRVVEQGKEAMVHHASEGAGSQGFDVAVKVYKRAQDFRSRADFVDGDPRFAGQSFRHANEREQLDLWTEKEYRNLVRATRAKVPVPVPLQYKENVLFMRFMGNNGWPAPKIREIGIRNGSQKWELLYSQVMESIRRLYKGAHLVHGDLSDFNILMAPVFQVENPISTEEETVDDLHPVFIDFGQAVDLRHPDATGLLLRDLERVRSFFINRGVSVLSVDESFEMVTQDLIGDEGSTFDEDVSSLPDGASTSNGIATFS